MERLYFWFFPSSLLNEYNNSLNKINEIELSLLENDSSILKYQETCSKTQNSTPNYNRTPSNSMLESSIYSRNDPGGLLLQTQALRGLKLFPIFDDHALAKFSINYFLYLEFFHMGIRIFGALLIFSCFVYTIYLIIRFFNPLIDDAAHSILGYGFFILISGVFLRIFRTYEERKLINHKVFYDFQWTQDLFSVFVENIPLDSDPDQLKVYLNKILMEQGVEGSVRDILFLQDYYQYAEVKNKINEIKQKLSQPYLLFDEKRALRFNLLLLEDQFKEMQEQVTKGKLFKGKAIVIFNTIQAKMCILNYFCPRLWKTLAYRYFGLVLKGCYFRGNLLKVREAKEPQDFICQNLYYPTSKRLLREVIAYFISFVIIFFGLNTLAGLQLWIRVSKYPETLVDTIQNTKIVLRSFILSLSLGKAYKFTNRLFIYRSYSDYDLGCLNYALFSSFTIYVIVQCIVAYRSTEIWLSQLLKISLFYLLQRILLKSFTIVSVWKSVQNSVYISWSELLCMLFQKFNEMWTKFDIIDGINCAVPIIFIGFAYMASNPFIFLPIIMLSLYVFAIIDKYRMIKYCAPIKIRSADYMLRAFKVYKWDCFCIFIGSIITVIGYSITVSRGQHKETMKFAIGMNIFAVVFAYIFWPVPFHVKAKKKFYQRNCSVKYESVSYKFSSVYQDEEFIQQSYKERAL